MPEKISKESWDGYYAAYFYGEAKGAELIWRLMDFIPGEYEKKWVEIWAREEELHHKLWAGLVKRKGLTPKQMSGSLSPLYDITEKYVDAHDWLGSMIGAAVIEHMSTAAALNLYKHADDETRVIFRKIVGDDVGHLHFDIEQIEQAAATPEGRKRIVELHKPFLREVMEWPFRKDLLDGELEILNDAYEMQRSRLAKFNVHLPAMHFSDSLSFRVRKMLITALA